MYMIRAIFRMLLFSITISFYIGWCFVNKLLFKDYLIRNKGVRARWIKLIVPILGFKASLKGTIPTEGVFLFVSNHRSFSDPLIMLRYIDAFPLAKAEVNGYPFIGVGARITGILYVERDKASSRQGARLAIRDTLEQNQSVLIYPEGTTSDDEGTTPFKRGSFQVAADLDIPVVPIAIEYQDRKHHWVSRSLWRQYVLQFGESSCHCTMSFGEPYHAADQDYGTEQARAWINQEVLAIRKRYDA